jgi:hypothetical protein
MSRNVVAAGQIGLGDVGMPPGHIMPTPYGIIVSTMNNPGFKEADAGFRKGVRYTIKLTDNTGLTKTYPVTGVNAGAGWYATFDVGQDLTKVFTRSASMAFVVSTELSEQEKAAEAEKVRTEAQARLQASAQASAVSAAQAQARAAAAEAADAANRQRIAQQQVELTKNSDELTRMRALAQAQAADLAAAQARSRADAAAAATAQARASDSGQSVRAHLYTDLGCWNDTPDRAISGGFVGTPGIDVYNPSRCYEVAMSKGHDIFAVQAGYSCFTGLAMRDNYKKYGQAPADNNCGISGGSWVNRVFSINKKDHVVPHEVGSYSDWSMIPSLFSDFQTQSSKLLDSLKFPDTSNPAPYMTAFDTNVNAIRDDIKLQEIKALNAQNVKDATQIFKDVTDMNPDFQENRAEAERLRRQILLSSSQTTGYENKTLPLQILAVTLALVLVVYFLAGFILSPTTASMLAIVLLTVGFGASVYYAFNKQSTPNNNG